jgi:predicted aldo/keto reductase-like oxidoreductase
MHSMQSDQDGEKIPSNGVSRRHFLIAAAILAGTKPIQWAHAEPTEIPRRELGRTGQRVSMIGLGGAHIGTQRDEKESIRIIRAALDNGINFLDNSWDYNDGQSEIRMGKALRDGYREKAFLMTKIDGRSKQGALRQLDESLERLATDHIDLLQLHEIIRMDDPDRIFAAGGAIETVIRAREAGKIRFIGFTGHKSPDIHLKMIATADQHGFHFDTVQMPLNVMDAHFKSFGEKVLPVAQAHGLGILGMKPMGSSFILDSKTVAAEDCLRYSLSLPVSVVITGCDSMKILDQALRVARSFKPLSEAERTSILAKTAPVAMAGKYELYKTSHHFDTTEKHPEYLS